MFLDPWRKQRIKFAARLQEVFDCYVLDLDWNKFICGARPAPEEIAENGDEPLSQSSERKLVDWYPADAINLPLHIARLVCQRANLWYDARLRTAYRSAVCVVTAAYFFALVLFGLELSLGAFILAVLIPFGPFFTWAVREVHRQSETIAVVHRLLGEIDGSIDRLSNPSTEDEARSRARELQNAIYAHRANSPLISDFVYWAKRNNLEKQMSAAAREFIERVEAARRAT